MPKPFSLQSPEAIAKEYGGNKQMIAQAMQSGIVDPTSGTLAGMFIDRMRSAQSQEMQPQPTIAQQVFAPPAAMPPGGLPPPGGMGGPQMGGPPMGAPPAAPTQQPGDQTLMMADGGLAGIPVPDTMFDEPSNGGFDDGYAHGGIVSFAEAGSINLADLLTRAQANKGLYAGLAPQDTEAQDAAMQMLRSEADPEAIKKRANEDKWFALAQLGAKMASTPGSLLQSASAGIQSALPGLQTASKERRADMRDAVMKRAELAGASNKEARELASQALSGEISMAELNQRIANSESQNQLERDKMKLDRELGYARIRAEKTIASMRRPDESKFDTMLRIMQTGKPEEKAALEALLKLQQQYAPSSASGLPPEFIRNVQGGRAAGQTNQDSGTYLGTMK
jgi:hypothetical protein